jgi:hypothetical protein
MVPNLTYQFDDYDLGDSTMERRAASRHDMYAVAVVEFGFESLRGLVLDVSASGVRICLPDSAVVPEVVTLQLPGGVVRTACCRWRQGDEAGFVFLPGGSQRMKPELTAFSPETAIRLSALG